MAKGKSIGIISIKGGVGKTTSVVNLAHTLANDFSKKVIIVDANFSAPNILLHLGNLECKNTLQDVLSKKVKLNDAIYKHDWGFHVIPSSTSSNGNNKAALKEKIHQLKSQYDIVLLDSSPSLNDELLAAMMASDELYVISTPDLPTLSTTLKATKLAREKKVNIHGMILNKVRGKNYELKPSDMERLSGVPLVGVIKDNVRVLEALSKVKPITRLSPNSNVSLAYKKLAAQMINASYKEPAWHTKALGYLRDDFTNLSTHKWSKGFSYYK